MDLDEHGSNVSGNTGPVMTSVAAGRSHKQWAVMNRDSQSLNPVLVTRWRWYAGWWAAWLRISDGNDMRIVRVG